MMKKKSIVTTCTVLLLLFAIVSCQGRIDVDIVSPTMVVDLPSDGLSTVRGQVISEKEKIPIENIVVRLAEVYREGEEAVFILDGAFSPGDITDDSGNFIIADIEAGEYVIVVGDVTDRYVIISESPNKAKVWEARPNEILEIGELLVNIDG
jgi:hypothetical protein